MHLSKVRRHVAKQQNANVLYVMNGKKNGVAFVIWYYKYLYHFYVYHKWKPRLGAENVLFFCLQYTCNSDYFKYNIHVIIIYICDTMIRHINTQGIHIQIPPTF